MRKFIRGKQKTVFLFDQAITDYLECLRKQGVILQELTSITNDRNVPVGLERSAAVKRESELFTWFMQEFESLVERFNTKSLGTRLT